MIVVDTNVIFPTFNESEKTALAEKVREKDPFWIVPPLWKDEYANVLCKMSRKSKVSSSLVEENLRTVIQHIEPCEQPIDYVDCLKLAFQRKLSFYDAQFVWLAMQNGTWLITEDDEVLKSVPKCAMSMGTFLGL